MTNQSVEDSDISLNGTLPLHEQILDLLFDLKPLENFSDYGLDTFVPSNKFEKILLLGLLKRSVIIFGTQGKPLVEHRYTNVDELITLSSEMILSLVKFNQNDLLLKIIESIVNFGNYNSNLLLQYALLLEKQGQHKLALEYLLLVSNVVQEPYLYFIIVHIYYVHLNDFESGINWCLKTLELKYLNSVMKAKCHMYLGVGYYWKCLIKRDSHLSTWGSAFASESSQQSNEVENSVLNLKHNDHYQVNPHDIVLSGLESYLSRELISHKNHNCCSSLLDQSMTHLKQALHDDRNNHLVHYYLALVSAQTGHMMDAMNHIKQALELHAEYLPSLHMLVLLESTWNIDRAEMLLLSTIREYPDNVQLHMTHAHINIKNENYVEAIENLREALLVWEKLYCDKKGDLKHVVNDTDSGQFSVDHKDKMELFNQLSSPSERTCIPEPEKDVTNTQVTSDDSNTVIPSGSKHVTFVFNKEYLLSNVSEEEEQILFDETPVGDRTVDHFLQCFLRKLATAKIRHNVLPSKLCLLVDIWGMFAHVYLHLHSPLDFVQCLSELMHICDVTSLHSSSVDSPPEPLPTLVLSEHCVEILFYLGLYYEEKGDLVKALYCFDNVLSISHHHVESLFHRGNIQKDLGQLTGALYTVHQCLKLSNIGPVKGKLYALMGDIFDGLGEYEKSAVCYEVAIQWNDILPVCSYDIIPFVWQ